MALRQSCNAQETMDLRERVHCPAVTTQRNPRQLAQPKMAPKTGKPHQRRRCTQKASVRRTTLMGTRRKLGLTRANMALTRAPPARLLPAHTPHHQAMTSRAQTAETEREATLIRSAKQTTETTGPESPTVDAPQRSAAPARSATYRRKLREQVSTPTLPEAEGQRENGVRTGGTRTILLFQRHHEPRKGLQPPNRHTEATATVRTLEATSPSASRAPQSTPHDKAALPNSTRQKRPAVNVIKSHRARRNAAQREKAIVRIRDPRRLGTSSRSCKDPAKTTERNSGIPAWTTVLQA